jgi:actin-related protein
VAGKHLTQYLSQLMSHTSMYFHFDTSTKIATDVKQKHCFVARDYRSAKKNVTIQNYTLPDGRLLQIEDEQFECAEILFNPLHVKHHLHKSKKSKYRKRSLSGQSTNEIRKFKKLKKTKFELGQENVNNKFKLDESLIRCVNNIDDDELEQEMYSNIYCVGASTKLPNFCHRLENQVQYSLMHKISIANPLDIQKNINVKLVGNPALSAWLGAQIIASQESFYKESWITLEEYHEYGQNIFDRKCTHQDL